MPLTITEALAEIKTINKRLARKREFVLQYLWRQEKLKDPLAKDGGSHDVLERERHAIRDLEERIIQIRRAIQKANDTNTIRLGDNERTIGEVLTWRREIEQGQRKFLGDIRSTIERVRREAQTKGLQVTGKDDAHRPDDIIINVEEKALASEIERLEQIAGDLDGQLSLKNATILIDV